MVPSTLVSPARPLMKAPILGSSVLYVCAARSSILKKAYLWFMNIDNDDDGWIESNIVNIFLYKKNAISYRTLQH
jgi:hypothetical protein